jgi:hypothetical protein
VGFAHPLLPSHEYAYSVAHTTSEIQAQEARHQSELDGTEPLNSIAYSVHLSEHADGPLL